MTTLIKRVSIAFVLVLLLVSAFSVTAFAEGETADLATQEALAADAVDSAEEAEAVIADPASMDKTKAISAGVVIAIAAAAGAIAMAIAISKSVSAISRQPEAEGGIRTSLMLGLVFIETAIIYALIIAILIIFVL